MPLTNRRRRAGLVALASLLLVLTGAGQARAATAVGSAADVWFTPGQPADNAVRLIVHIADDADPAIAPGTAERITVYLPGEVTLQGDGFPRCSLATIQRSGIQACPAASQLGSGTIKGKVGAAGAPVEFRAYVLNGSAPGGVIFYLDQPNGAAQIAFEGQLMPSDDPPYGSMLVVPIPPELQQPLLGVYLPITDVDILLHANAGGPFVAIAGCPPVPPGFKTLVSFNAAAPGAPTGPLSSTTAATCTAAPPPPVNPIPRPAPPPPAPPAPPPPTPESSERAVAAFGVRLQRKDGKVRRLRLTGMSRGTRVSVRCLQRCGRRGAELRKSVHDGKVELKRALRPRGRFEVRLSQTGRVTRFARYRVDRRGRTATRTRVGCLDDRGAERACPAAR